MKRVQFEHRRQNILPWPRFVVRVGRFGLFAGGLIVFSIAIGVLGYRHFGHLNWVDSFHMASMILTGMGPVVEMNTIAAKLFSSFYALYSGIAFLSASAVFFTPIVHRLLHVLQVEKPASGSGDEGDS